VTKTVADVEKKIELLDGTEEMQKGRGWIFWAVIPLVLAAVGSVAFLVVRRRFGNSDH
jgi:hypothetical protein